MRTTGKLRRLDNLGRIIIPRNVREELKLKDYELFEVFIDGNSIILKKYNPAFNKRTNDMPEQITFE